MYAYFFKAHGAELVYFACVFWAGDRGAGVDMRPESCRLFEHLRVKLVLEQEPMRNRMVLSLEGHHVDHNINEPSLGSSISCMWMWFFFKTWQTLKSQSQTWPTWLATTASCGSSGSAAANKACSDRRTVLSVMAAALLCIACHGQRSGSWQTRLLVCKNNNTGMVPNDSLKQNSKLPRKSSTTHHWSLRMSRHIAPVTELMLGCQIFVIKRTLGRQDHRQLRIAHRHVLNNTCWWLSLRHLP